MGERQWQNAGTAHIRDGHQFDIARLDAWLEANVEGYAGPLRVEQFRGGQSNPTFKLITPHRHYVMRRKPVGTLVPGAHAVEREFRVIAALFAEGFPVARPYVLCTQEDVIGTWFYIMEMVEGRSIWETSFPDAPRAERPRYFDSMNETVARLHSLDYAALGLSTFGRPGRYIARQVERWSRQYAEDSAGGRDPNLDRLVEWLPAHIPANDETTLVHGDFRCDNMIFHPTEPRVIAVLDWELSTLGHPLADFAFNAMVYRIPPALITGLKGIDLAAANIPSEEAYLQAYCHRTGRDIIPDYDFYVAFNMFRLATILHGIKARLIRGTAASLHAKQMAAHVEPLAEIAWTQAMRR
jgi:aminoglycoside phosphotransferase (APT) family kinase protein